MGNDHVSELDKTGALLQPGLSELNVKDVAAKSGLAGMKSS